MTDQQFRDQATVALKKLGAKKFDVFTQRPHGSEKIFGVTAEFDQKQFELTVAHGKYDESSMQMALEAIRRGPA